MVSELTKARKASATMSSSAMSPGAPMTFSIHCETCAPWSPPGLNMRSPKMGLRNFAKVTEHQMVMMARLKNHFQRFSW